MVAPPLDVDLVQSAIRLGWYVAEVRGRNRPGGPPGAAVDVPPRTGHPLPLRIERSHDEQRIQAQVAVCDLAAKLKVDTTPAGNLAQTIDDRARTLATLRGAVSPDQQAVATAWDQLADATWTFDAHVQDQLTATSDTQACGYQLGRGLAETYWALDPGADQGWSSWNFLFDKARGAELGRLTARLSTYMQDFAGPAIAGSIEVWKLLASDAEWRRQPTAVPDLYSQLRTWYELLVLGKDPTTDIRPFQLIRNWRATVRAVRVFAAQLLLAAVGVAGVFLLLFLLSDHKTSHLAEALAGVLATVGLSIAGLSATVKSQAQALGTRLRQDIYTDLIAIAITTAPPPPPGKHGRSERAVLEKTVSKRTLTPTTPLR